MVSEKKLNKYLFIYICCFKTKQNKTEMVLMVGFTMQLKQDCFGLAGPAALLERAALKKLLGNVMCH